MLGFSGLFPAATVISRELPSPLTGSLALTNSARGDTSELLNHVVTSLKKLTGNNVLALLTNTSDSL